MSMKALFIYWPLLSIATAFVFCRLIHKAKLADRAMQAQQRRDLAPRERNTEVQVTHSDHASARLAA
ncbi:MULTISPECIES: hypothetical protein [unclassified Pseudomonas]|jgi:hypothetical protein|uniref:hypothetical protein n=1 Tax=unclassified Pseudomonas TaxID=196821 RepID=UPI00070324F1|nr:MULTISPECIES: hypothetical protein [unclassified Pseudomonas]KQZ78732.1 hypothetical protein ASD60_17545 [Pseudomonas sp. Root562]